jgi:uncharacterized membrane protein YagU involved in acid resistance
MTHSWEEEKMDAKRIKNGALGGMAGGAVFGMMMAMMGMLPMIGKMVGQPTAPAGFAVHMVNSVIIGAAFAMVFGHWVQGLRNGLTYGLTYGAVWWVLGPLTLMPLLLGMGLGVNWTAAAAVKMLPSLLGHLIYGAILGITYARLHYRSSSQDSKLVPRAV